MTILDQIKKIEMQGNPDPSSLNEEAIRKEIDFLFDAYQDAKKHPKTKESFTHFIEDSVLNLARVGRYNLAKEYADRFQKEVYEVPK